MASADQVLLLEEVEKKIEFGNGLIDKLTIIQNVEGVPKMQRKIKQELTFLKKLKNSTYIKKEQLSSSNLRHLSAIVTCALKPGVISVCKILHLNNGNKVSIDIICEQGKVWTKVVARNPKSLSALSDGDASYGARSVLDQAQDYLNCASEHPFLYQTPKIVFKFVSGIEDILAKKLEELGITVEGDLIYINRNIESDSDSEYFQSEDDMYTERSLDSKTVSNCPQAKFHIVDLDILNLDVTTMMAYVSNLTNGHYNFVFKQQLLSQQAIWEAKRPVKPILEDLFKDKSLVCCQAAWDDFIKIVNILGGQNEKKRTEQLKERLTIMPNDQNGPDDQKRAELKVKGRIRLRSKIVFNFGERIRALTISANEGFVRSAKQQGLAYAAIIHESRALTEEKEKTAISKILTL